MTAIRKSHANLISNLEMTRPGPVGGSGREYAKSRISGAAFPLKISTDTPARFLGPLPPPFYPFYTIYRLITEGGCTFLLFFIFFMVEIFLHFAIKIVLLLIEKPHVMY